MNTDHSDVFQENILIVDDTPANLRLLVEILAERGYEVRPVTNGKLALWAARGTTPPDLILLDIMMPDMDGYEVCRQLKADARTHDIPIIFISALHEMADKLKGFTLGGMDYITKPFQEQEVLARVKAHAIIRRRQQQLLALNAGKDRFLSIIAHDLKNPFSGFVSLVNLLEKSVNTWNKDHILELTALLQTSAEHLSALLENLLTWSRLQRGMLEYCAGPLDLYPQRSRRIRHSKCADHRRDNQRI